MPRVRNLTTDVAPIPLLRIIAVTPGSVAICRDLDGLQSTRRVCVCGAVPEAGVAICDRLRMIHATLECDRDAA